MFFKDFKNFNTKEYDEFYEKLKEELGINNFWSGIFHDSLAPISYMPNIFSNIFLTSTMQNSKDKLQTTCCYKDNPRMICSRYDHMVSSFLLGVDLLMTLEKNGYEINAKTKVCFLSFLATHDIGHGPFSHPFELMVDGYKGMHEGIGRRTILERQDVREALEKIYPELPQDIVDFQKNNPYGLYSLLEGIFDLDRAAYLITDTFESNDKRNVSKKERLVKAIYNIFDNIILQNGKVLFKEEALPDIEYFLEQRKENYDKLYLSKYEQLIDALLARIGKKTTKDNFLINYALGVEDGFIKDKVSKFSSFIREMKSKKEDIDLDLYHSYSDTFFFEIFNYLLLNDFDEELFCDCLINLSPLEVMTSLYDIKEFKTKKELEEFLEKNVSLSSVFKIGTYKSTEKENILIARRDGTIIDYKEHPGRKLDISEEKRFYAYRIKEEQEISISEEQEIEKILERKIRKYVTDNNFLFKYLARDSMDEKSRLYANLVELTQFLELGGTLFDYAIYKEKSIKEVLLPIFIASDEPLIKECITIMMLPSNKIKNFVEVITPDSMEEKDSMIASIQESLSRNKENKNDESNYSNQYIQKNLMITDEFTTSFLLYKPLFNKPNCLSQTCKDNIENVILNNSRNKTGKLEKKAYESS